MSTTLDNTQLDDDLTPPPARSGGNLRFINISNGAMTEWQKGKENLPIEVVVGYLERVHIYTNIEMGNTKLEVELKNPAEGTFVVSVSMENSVGSGMMMDFLLCCKEGDLISIRANPSPDKNKHGHYTTFIEGHVKIKGLWSKHECAKPKGPKWREYIASSLQEDFMNLPFFRARPKKGGDEEGEYQFFKQEILAKGWPSIDGNEDAYLAWMNGALGLERKSLQDFEEDEWNEIRPVVAAAKKIPKVLQNPFEGE